jgi:hypothetical protein
MNIRTILAVLTLACITVLTGYLVLRSDSEHQASHSAGESVERTSGILAARNPTVDTATQVGTRRDVQSRDSAPLGSRELVNAAPDLFDLMRSLATKAYEGDAEAQLTIARAMSLCMGALPYVNVSATALALPSHSIPVGELEGTCERCCAVRKDEGQRSVRRITPDRGRIHLRVLAGASPRGWTFARRSDPQLPENNSVAVANMSSAGNSPCNSTNAC